MTGGHFAHMRLSPDFGGVAHTSTYGNFSASIVVLGGLLGPSIAGAFLLVLSRGLNQNRLALCLLIAALGLTIVFWSANTFTRISLSGIAAIITIITLKAPAMIHSLCAHIIAIAFCLSAVARFDYFFADRAVIGTTSGQSDTHVLTEIIGGTHFIWGITLSLIALLILYGAFRLANKLSQESNA